MSDNGNHSSEPQIQERASEGRNANQSTDARITQIIRASDLPLKKQVCMRIDEDILDFFKQKGTRYQTKMHAVLRAYVDACKIANNK